MTATGRTFPWRRLNAGVIVLLALLLVGVGLVLWVERSRAAALEHSEQLARLAERVHRDLAELDAAARGIALELPDAAKERRRHAETKDDLLDLLKTNDSRLQRYPDLQAAIQELRQHVTGRLSQFHRSILGEGSPVPGAAAQAAYLRDAKPVREAQDQLLATFQQQVDRAKYLETDRAQTTAILGLAGLAVVLLLSFVMVFVQSSAVTRPLGELVAALDRMRQGDFTQRLHWQRGDEFGVLGNGLDRLADDLSGLVAQVQRAGIQVNLTATGIAATAREQQSTASEIAATTAEIGATSKQISATSKELVKTMSEVSQVSDEAAQLANSGQTAIARMEATMHEIMDAAGAISAKLAVVNEKTTNINSVVTTITKVADQTNLLSLNAAIEAEKAGEYGLGFAVVAMEIRRLADQTAVATYDIERMVKEMQSAVAAGVMGMDKFAEEVRRGVEGIRQVSVQLAQIIQHVQTLTPRFQLVNEGMQAQATGASQISETLVQLSDSAHQTAQSLRQSNLAIEQLNEAARHLQSSVARFKLAS